MHRRIAFSVVFLLVLTCAQVSPVHCQADTPRAKSEAKAEGRVSIQSSPVSEYVDRGPVRPVGDYKFFYRHLFQWEGGPRPEGTLAGETPKPENWPKSKTELGGVPGQTTTNCPRHALSWAKSSWGVDYGQVLDPKTQKWHYYQWFHTKSEARAAGSQPCSVISETWITDPWIFEPDLFPTPDPEPVEKWIYGEWSFAGEVSTAGLGELAETELVTGSSWLFGLSVDGSQPSDLLSISVGTGGNGGKWASCSGNADLLLFHNGEHKTFADIQALFMSYWDPLDYSWSIPESDPVTLALAYRLPDDFDSAEVSLSLYTSAADAVAPPIPEPVFFQMGAMIGLSGLGLLRLRRRA